MFSLWEVQWENSHVGRLRVQFHLHASISLGKAQLIMVPSHMDLLLLPNLKKKKKIRRLQIFFFFKNCIIKHPKYIGMSVLGQQKVNSWFVRSHLLLFLLTPVPLTGFIVHEQQARPGFLSHHYFKHFLTLKEWRTQRRRQRLCSQHLAAEVTHCATNLTSHCSPLPSPPPSFTPHLPLCSGSCSRKNISLNTNYGWSECTAIIQLVSRFTYVTTWVLLQMDTLVTEIELF